MATPKISTKRVAISKANAQMVAAVAVASFIAVFALVAGQAIWSQNSYQSRVVKEKEKAYRQLKDNTEAFEELKESYTKFDGQTTNVIGGNKGGEGERDGNNARIVLDALPSAYDFPALTSSLEKVLKGKNFTITSIIGTDDEASQSASKTSPTPTPVEMPFSFGITNSNYDSVKDLIVTLERSIRPVQIDKLNISGGTDNMTMSVEAHTYYQPGKNVTITKKVVR